MGPEKLLSEALSSIVVRGFLMEPDAIGDPPHVGKMNSVASLTQQQNYALGYSINV